MRRPLRKVANDNPPAIDDIPVDRQRPPERAIKRRAAKMSDSPPGVEHSDSIESNDSNGKAPEKKKSRRPASECQPSRRRRPFREPGTRATDDEATGIPVTGLWEDGR